MARDGLLRILLLGANGQIGAQLQHALRPLGEVIAIARSDCDLGNLADVAALVATTKPELIVNAAAYTSVDGAETERHHARQINAKLPELLANLAAARDILVVDFSTDYVFDGSKTSPWVETDATVPLNYYGETKLAGLRALEASGCRYLVFRVAWVYSQRGNNFPNTILRLATERDRLAVVNDQMGAPTPADWIACVAAQCIRQVVDDSRKCGVYHLAPEGSTSWYAFAQEILLQATLERKPLRLKPEHLEAISSLDYPTVAKRPVNSLLDTSKLKDTFAILLPHWRALWRRDKGKSEC